MSPRQVGHYRLDSLLGSGGMGDVYRAHDTYRDRYVALKLLPEALAEDPEYLERFRRESRVAARLTEPHVIPVHDFGAFGGQLFIDMRLVDGADLGTLLQSCGRIAPQRAVNLIGQVAQALDAAHADHLVHRDIKPSNILITSNDFVYVADFGIARTTGGRHTPLTIGGKTVGTLQYMAPERFTGHDVDGRADVYSLACVLQECLTGEPPFAGKDLPALTYAQLHSGPPPASRLVEGLPPALDAVIARGMAKDPKDRFATAGLLAAAAREALLTGAPATPLPATAPVPARTERLFPAGQAVTALAAGQVAAKTLAPETKPPADRSARDSPTQTVGGARVSDQGGSGLPPDEATGEPARRGPGWRRLGVLLLILAAAIAVPVSLLATASSRPNTTGAAATPSTSGPAGSRPSLAIPAVTKKIAAGPTPSYIQVTPNGKYAYIANPGADTICVLNTATERVTKTFKIPQGPPQFISFSPDGRTAYVSVYNGSNSVHLIAFVATATHKVTSIVPVNNHTPGVTTTSPDGRYLYVSNHNMAMGGAGDNVIDVIDLATKKVTSSISVIANPHSIAFDKKNGQYYVTDHMSVYVTALSTRTNRVIAKIEVGETPHGETLSPDGSRLAVTSFNGNEVFIVDTATDKEVAVIPVGRTPLGIAYSLDGRYLFTADNEDNTVTVIDTADNRVMAEIPTGKAPTSIAVLPNGRQAYVSDENSGTIEVLDIPPAG